MAAEEKSGDGKATVHFGEYLVEQGLIESDHRDDALAIQDAVNQKLGIMATMDDILTVTQVYTILDEQRSTKLPFGQVARTLNLIDEEHLEKLLDRQNELWMRVGEILVGLGYIEYDRMETELEEFCAEYNELS